MRPYVIVDLPFFLQVCTRRPPHYQHRLLPTIARATSSGLRPARPSMEDCHGAPPEDELWLLIEACWRHEPTLRAPIEQVCNHFRQTNRYSFNHFFNSTDEQPTLSSNNYPESFSVLLVGSTGDIELDAHRPHLLKVVGALAQELASLNVHTSTRLLVVAMDTPLSQSLEFGRHEYLQKIYGLLQAHVTQAHTKPAFVWFLISRQATGYIYRSVLRWCNLNLGLSGLFLFVDQLQNAHIGNGTDDNDLLYVLARTQLQLGLSHSLLLRSSHWLKEQRGLLIGCSIARPSLKSMQGTPSVAAVVANSDLDFTHFPFSLALQGSHSVVCIKSTPCKYEMVNHAIIDHRRP
jgi:hypothetical protein